MECKKCGMPITGMTCVYCAEYQGEVKVEPKVNPRYVKAALAAALRYTNAVEEGSTAPPDLTLDWYQEQGVEPVVLVDLMTSLLHTAQCLKNEGLQTMDPRFVLERAWNHFNCEVLDPDDIELDRRAVEKENYGT